VNSFASFVKGSLQIAPSLSSRKTALDYRIHVFKYIGNEKRIWWDAALGLSSVVVVKITAVNLYIQLNAIAQRSVKSLLNDCISLLHETPFYGVLESSLAKCRLPRFVRRRSSLALELLFSARS